MVSAKYEKTSPQNLTIMLFRCTRGLHFADNEWPKKNSVVKSMWTNNEKNTNACSWLEMKSLQTEQLTRSVHTNHFTRASCLSFTF